MTAKNHKTNYLMACVAGGIFLATLVCTIVGFQNSYLTNMEQITAPILGVISGLLTLGYLFLPRKYNRLLGNVFVITTGAFLLTGQFESVFSAENNFQFYLIWVPAFYLMLTFADLKGTRYRWVLSYFILSLVTIVAGIIASQSSINNIHVLLLVNTLIGQLVIIAIFDFLGRSIRKAAAHEAVAKTLAVSAERLKIAADMSNAARKEAESANSAKSAFIANMSHELRTPLNAIIGFSDILIDPSMREYSKERVVEYATDINTSGRHLLSLVNDILDVAKIESGKMEIAESDFCLKSAIEAAAAMMGPRDNQASGRIETANVHEGLYILADQRMVKQMIANLLSNAIKFTPEGGRIYFSTQLCADGRLELCLTDEGVGMSREVLDHIMQPFVQGEDVYTRQRSGTGLGLHIVKIMMELHGGRCRIDSEPGLGTTAKLVFPASRVCTSNQNIETHISAIG